METLLELLFARYERPEALTVLQDLEARERAKGEMATDLESAGMKQGMLTTSEGDNLFVAVLALRLRFPQDEARDKVALNISMREQRRRTS
jgi:hypothetical protein